MRLALEIYFGLVLLIAGYEIGTEYGTGGKFKGWEWLVWAVVILFAPFIYGYQILEILWAWVNRMTGISFWFRFYVLKAFDNMEPEKLRRVNHLSPGDEKGWKYNITKACLRAINKRNSHTVMVGTLSVSEDELPQVTTNNGVFNLSGCNLTKHADGSWNFNMTLSGRYTTHKQGDEVNGAISKDKTFTAWSLVKKT